MQVLAFAFLMLFVIAAAPLQAQTAAQQWSPERPRKSLSETRVVPRLQPVPQRSVATQGTSNAWVGANAQATQRLRDTSTHLNWGSNGKSKQVATKNTARKSAPNKVSLASRRVKNPVPVRQVSNQVEQRSSQMPSFVKPRQAKPTSPKRSLTEVQSLSEIHSRANVLPQRVHRSVLKRPSTSGRIQLVQNESDDLFGDDLLDFGTTEPAAPSQSTPSSSSSDSPFDDIFESPDARSSQPAPEPSSNQFKDLTPTDNTPVPSQQLRQPVPPQTLGPIAPEPQSFDQPQAPQTEAFSAPTQSSPDSSLMQPMNGMTKPTQDAKGDLRAKFQELDEQLQGIEPLPPVPGSDDGDGEAEQLPAPGEEKQNPLDIFNDEDDDEQADEPEAKTDELAATNDRDCNAQSEACEKDFAYLRRRQRTDMSLDITPSIEPTEVDMAKVERVRIEKLSKAPPKMWTDRRGNVIADGNLDDYRDGKVVVRTVNGTLQQIPLHTLSDDDRCFVRAWWELPDECNFEGEQFAMRDFRLTTFTWTAASICHKPLYFEQVAVERHGHSAGPIVQPILSGAHFFGDILLLPYHAGMTPPKECIYTLGHFRPGNCAPWLMPGFPFSDRGFKFEGLALGAAIALLP